MLKKFLNLFAIFFGLALFTLLTFIFYKNASKKLSQYSQIESKVIDKGITKLKKKSKIFYLKLSKSKENFAVYNMTKDYEELENIKIGDKIKLYFEPSNISNTEYNLNVVQIEKSHQILLNYNEHKIKYYSLTGISVLAILFMLDMTFQYLKYGKYENPIPPIF